MRWKQFFTPVASLDALEAAQLIEREDVNAYTLLDVRQPREYAGGHLAGAKLIPLGELDSRLDELDPNKPVIVY